jgi:hypothetical protein
VQFPTQATLVPWSQALSGGAHPQKMSVVQATPGSTHWPVSGQATSPPQSLLQSATQLALSSQALQV